MFEFSLTLESPLWQCWAHFPGGQQLAWGWATAAPLNRAHTGPYFVVLPTPSCLPNTVTAWQVSFLIVITLSSVLHPVPFIHLHHLPGPFWHEFASPVFLKNPI